MQAKDMVIGEEYNFCRQEERLIYIGNNFSGNGLWHQLEKISERGIVWAELQSGDLCLIELTAKESNND